MGWQTSGSESPGLTKGLVSMLWGREDPHADLPEGGTGFANLRSPKKGLMYCFLPLCLTLPINFSVDNWTYLIVY